MIAVGDLRQKFGAEAALIVLLLRCYFKKATPDDLASYLQQHTVDWKHFYQLAYEYEIRPLIYKIITSNAIEADPAWVQKLKEDCFFIAGANLKRLQELLRLLILFREQGIKVVPFKGVFLSQALFGDLSTRETCDIDFLVDARDTVKITRILSAEGYQTDYYFDEKNEAHLLRISCERGFYKTDEVTGRLSVEIHWEVLLPSSDVPLFNKDLFGDLQKTTLAGNEVEILPAENTLITLLAHHGVTDVWRTLKHVADLAAFLANDPLVAEKPFLQKRLKELRLTKVATTGMQLAHALLGTPVPSGYNKGIAPVTEKVLDNLLRYPMLSRFKYSPHHLRQHLQLRDNPTDKFRLAGAWLTLLFVPTADDLRSINFPNRFLLLYYFVKPFRLLNRYFTKRGGS